MLASRTAVTGNGQDAFSEALARGRHHWPQVDLGEEALAQQVRLHQISDAILLERAADLYLVAACVAGVPAAAVAFERTYLPLVETYVSRLGLSADLLDEVRQRLRIRLLAGPTPRIASYNGTAPLGGYLRVCAVRVALDVLADGGPPLVPLGDEHLARGLAEQGDTNRSGLKRRYLPAFQTALENSIATLPVRDRAILRFHFVDGMNIEALGTVYQVHRATAARWLVDIRRRVFEGVRQQLSLDFRTSSSEFRSLLNAVGSDLHATLTRLLTP
jgi:RNA polymerase sigma-70 factor, ECF subfamily